MTKKKHTYGKANQAHRGLPSTESTEKNEPTAGTKDHAEGKMNPPEKRWWGLTRFEWIMSILTLAGVLIAIFTGLIFREQLHEMRTDQRAWISFTAGQAQFPKDATFINTVPVSIPITINNTGKTAARAVRGDLVMEYVVNGESPDFVYSVPRVNLSVGMLSPNSPQPLPIVFSKDKFPNGTGPENRFLSPYEYQALTEGRGFMVVYGRVSYSDVFDTPHWTQYCTFFAAPGATVNVTAKACTDYNDTDQN